ncbi:MAG: hypothetical protein JXR96_20910 [Deltaproteobacteria bacterium]|nr:hypothetical protein [Deltaproteobacteria bacterium]
MLAPYLSPEARDAALADLAARAGADRIPFGQSVEGRPLLAVRIPSTGPGGQSPRVLCTANIHGPEYISAAAALGLIARLGSRQGELAARLRQRAEIWVLPCLNPDGYARTWRLEGRGRLRALRPNARGVDLNRNFPMPCGASASWIPGAGSTRPGAATYRGPHALSEPETAALDALCAEQRFHAAAALHSFMGTVIPARVTDRACFRAYRELHRAFRAAQPRVAYLRLASRHLDVFTGELEDHLHHARDCWAICVEHMSLLASVRQHLRAPCLFWRYNPRRPEPWVENDVPGILAFLLAAVDLPRPQALTAGLR